ncbi:uncharacterized protein LOC127081624 [Lathyrus oleraceus]|uniref:uncharacterized protein LOC127081624 n=1 Tax=Pisum sativum TaxID=3888 RepID=UPI0021CF9A2D|nr:uncharacterized protein LOC127081624 [Pisum sativum]
MTYTELYPSLFQKGLVVPRPLGPPPDPLPPWYNPNAHCPFHEVRELVEKKILSFRDLGPNVKSNPLPAHETVNAIEEASNGDVIKDVANIKTPLLAFHARLVEAGLVSACHKDCEECAIHPEGCEMSLEITYRRKDIVQPINHLSPVVICMPSPFPYESTKSVPWKYDITVIDKESEEVRQEESSKVDGVEVTNITGTSQMTRSGRIYTPQFNVASQAPTKETTAAAPVRKKNMVQSNEDAEFLKIIKKSDYKVVDQLHQTPSKISILSLLMCSPAHRNALLKVLTQAHVTQDIMVGQFDGVVTNITACNILSFNGGEFPKEGQNQNRALHVSVKCQKDTLARVLVDTGSSLNVLPKRPLAKLAFQGSEMRPSALIVKTFDGSRRTVVGQVKLPILIGPHADEDSLETSFQALEIANATFVEVKESVEKVIPSFSSVKGTKITIENGSPEGWGQVIDISMKKDCFGLGYNPFAKEGASIPTKDCVRRIQEVFLSAGYVYGDQVNTVEEDTKDEDMTNQVYQYEATLTNWEAIEIPEVIPISK